MTSAPIGVFDSGYGGLTILSEIRKRLPQYDYLYLGDNARSPYGTRSFDVIRGFTHEAVEYLFSEGCPLVILACNTASAKLLGSFSNTICPIPQIPHGVSSVSYVLQWRPYQASLRQDMWG